MPGSGGVHKNSLYKIYDQCPYHLCKEVWRPKLTKKAVQECDVFLCPQCVEDQERKNQNKVSEQKT